MSNQPPPPPMPEFMPLLVFLGISLAVGCIRVFGHRVGTATLRVPSGVTVPLPVPQCCRLWTGDGRWAMLQAVWLGPSSKLSS